MTNKKFVWCTSKIDAANRFYTMGAYKIIVYLSNSFGVFFLTVGENVNRFSTVDALKIDIVKR